MAVLTLGGAVNWLVEINCPKVASHASTVLELLITEGVGLIVLPYIFSVATVRTAICPSLVGSDNTSLALDTV